MEKIDSYIELLKPRILSLVLVTTALGYFLGGHGIQSALALVHLLFGTACVCGGSAALNHYLERDADAKMNRTKNRPIPSGDIPATNALIFGIILTLAGVCYLYLKINLLTAFLALLTAFMYVLVYTPLKKVTWLNTTIGAIPGALPPMGGWAAATGNLDVGAWILFAILFLWQHPHFFAIAWMFKEDYKQGGFKMLPVVEPHGQSTFKQTIWSLLFLIPVSIAPTLIGMSGKIYAVGALISGIYFLKSGWDFTQSKSIADARSLLKVSVIYLPILLILIVLDKQF